MTTNLSRTRSCVRAALGRAGRGACGVPSAALPVSAAPPPALAGGGDWTGAARARGWPRRAAAGHDGRRPGRGRGRGPRFRAAAFPGGQATVGPLLRDLLLPPRAGQQGAADHLRVRREPGGWEESAGAPGGSAGLRERSGCWPDSGGPEAGESRGAACPRALRSHSGQRVAGNGEREVSLTPEPVWVASALRTGHVFRVRTFALFGNQTTSEQVSAGAPYRGLLLQDGKRTCAFRSTSELKRAIRTCPSNVS